MFPELKDESIITYLGIVKNQLSLLDEADGVLYPNDVGRMVYKTKSPEPLKSRLLHEVVGFDIILLSLKKMGELSRVELVSFLQSQHPSWSTDFMPSSLIAWSRSMGLIDKNEQTRMYSLAPRGQSWFEWMRGSKEISIQSLSQKFSKKVEPHFRGKRVNWKRQV